VEDRLQQHVRALVYTNVNDVIFHLKVEGERFRFLEINPAFTRATGLSTEQVVGQFVDDIIPEPSRSLVLAKYREALSERRTVRWEEVTEYPTGTKVGEVSVTPVVEPDGRITQLVGTVCDVTEVRAQGEVIRRYADLVRSVRIGLGVFTIDDPNDPATFRLAAYNPELERMTRVELGPWLGKGLLEILPAVRGGKITGMLADVARDGVSRFEPAVRSLVERSTVLAVQVFRLPGRSVGMALEDITTSFRATHLQNGERRVLELLASGMPLGEVLAALVHMIELLEPGCVASVLLLDESGTRLRHGAAPGLPDVYNRAIDGAPIGPKAGSCGTAAYLGRQVQVADILADPLWEDYLELARLIGMRSCWSTPIVGNGGRVLGTFAIYRRVVGLPDPTALDLIARATHVAAIVIERRHLDEELSALSARIEKAREDERTGIAREIHDELGQALTALKLDMAWIARRLTGGEIADKLGAMSRMADEVIRSVRRISAELRPGILDDLGLPAAIEWQAGDFAARTGIQSAVRNEVGGAKLDLERELATAAFRICQEALTNVARHARATHVDISLRVVDGALHLEIADDGVGLPDTATRRGSLGLVGMRERARRLGGDCVVARREPRGTRVFLTVPLRRKDIDHRLGA
jgi:PAS domain S-box-containing protein